MGQVAPKAFPAPGQLQATNEAPRVVTPVQPTPYIPNPGVRSLLSNYQTPAVASPNSTNTSDTSATASPKPPVNPRWWEGGKGTMFNR